MPELLSPAGNFEKLKAALLYGADAVYLAGNHFGMRSAADNFTDEELKAAVEYAHARNKKLYLTVNTMPHACEYGRLREFLHTVGNYGIDACIVADLGVLATIKEIIPDMEIHISTQASIVSPAAALAYASLGAKRLVLARELTLSEIAGIRDALPPEVELEAFVHGSMCVSYSGRCILSNYFTGRDANRGACTQPCRWNYRIVEEKRQDEPLPVEENELGTFIMSSKDMCTIGIIPELIRAGIDSFKIEGRMKSAYYTAVVTNAYRMAIDAYCASPDTYTADAGLYRELESVSHREYCTGFYLDDPHDKAQLASDVGYIREKSYFAIAVEYDDGEAPCGLERVNGDGYLACFVQKNKVTAGQRAEMISPGRLGRAFTVEKIYLPDGSETESAPHPSMKFFVRIPFEVRAGDIMRSADAN